MATPKKTAQTPAPKRRRVHRWDPRTRRWIWEWK